MISKDEVGQLEALKVILPEGRDGPEMAEKFSDFLKVGGE
jgi:hypothetical protein